MSIYLVSLFFLTSYYFNIMSSLPFHYEVDLVNINKPFSSISSNSFPEPTSVLDSARFPSRQASSSSLSNGALQNYVMDEFDFVLGNGSVSVGDMDLWFGCTQPNPSQIYPNQPILNLQVPSYIQLEENFVLPTQVKNHDHVYENMHHLLPNYVNQNIGIWDGKIIDHLYKISELVQTGNLLLAQEILARLNHQLSTIGKPFYRAAFYFKEALQLLLQNITNQTTLTTSFSPFSIVFKISAYKTYSEISPLIHFANFTCNQAILDAMEGFERIHIVDFDIGYGCQWASFMKELGMRSGVTPFLKITAIVSLSTHDQLELGICRENLIQFASEVNVPFEFEVMSVDSLDSCSWSVSFCPCENEGMAVNLPVSVLYSYQVSVPLVLRFVKQLCPKIVVSVDKGCDRNDLPFANHVINAVQCYSNLLECLDAVNVNVDVLQKIEKFLFQPGIEKIVMGRFRAIDKTQHWRTLFLSAGFSPVSFSSFAELQAECVVKRSSVRGFQVEKRQASLVLSWQRKELVSVWAWKC